MYSHPPLRRMLEMKHRPRRLVAGGSLIRIFASESKWGECLSEIRMPSLSNYIHIFLDHDDVMMSPRIIRMIVNRYCEYMH